MLKQQKEKPPKKPVTTTSCKSNSLQYKFKFQQQPSEHQLIYKDVFFSLC